MVESPNNADLFHNLCQEVDDSLKWYAFKKPGGAFRGEIKKYLPSDPLKKQWNNGLTISSYAGGRVKKTYAKNDHINPNDVTYKGDPPKNCTNQDCVVLYEEPRISKLSDNVRKKIDACYLVSTNDNSEQEIDENHDNNVENNNNIKGILSGTITYLEDCRFGVYVSIQIKSTNFDFVFVPKSEKELLSQIIESFLLKEPVNIHYKIRNWRKPIWKISKIATGIQFSDDHTKLIDNFQAEQIIKDGYSLSPQTKNVTNSNNDNKSVSKDDIYNQYALLERNEKIDFINKLLTILCYILGPTSIILSLYTLGVFISTTEAYHHYKQGDNIEVARSIESSTVNGVENTAIFFKDMIASIIDWPLSRAYNSMHSIFQNSSMFYKHETVSLLNNPRDAGQLLQNMIFSGWRGYKTYTPPISSLPYHYDVNSLSWFCDDNYLENLGYNINLENKINSVINNIVNSDEIYINPDHIFALMYQDIGIPKTHNQQTELLKKYLRKYIILQNGQRITSPEDYLNILFNLYGEDSEKYTAAHAIMFYAIIGF